MAVVINDLDFEVLDGGRGEQREAERAEPAQRPAAALRLEDVERAPLTRRERRARVLAD
jgi:hypothetical protein